MKIDIVTNFDEHELTIETCSELIKMLEMSYKTIREDFYIKFFDLKHLRHVLMICILSLFCYFLSENVIFIYILPIIFAGFMIISMLIAEYLTNKTRKVINLEIEKLIKRKEYLSKQEEA